MIVALTKFNLLSVLEDEYLADKYILSLCECQVHSQHLMAVA